MKQSTCRYFHRHRHTMRIVRVQHVGLQLLHQARQAPRRAQIHLGLWRDRHQLEAFFRTLAQLAGRVRDEHRPVSYRAKSEDCEQHLVLAAAPGACGVDVEGEHV